MSRLCVKVRTQKQVLSEILKWGAATRQVPHVGQGPSLNVKRKKGTRREVLGKINDKVSQQRAYHKSKHVSKNVEDSE